MLVAAVKHTGWIVCGSPAKAGNIAVNSGDRYGLPVISAAADSHRTTPTLS